MNGARYVHTPFAGVAWSKSNKHQPSGRLLEPSRERVTLRFYMVPLESRRLTLPKDHEEARRP